MVQKVSLIFQCKKISKPDILVDSRQLFIIRNITSSTRFIYFYSRLGRDIGKLKHLSSSFTLIGSPASSLFTCNIAHCSGGHSIRLFSTWHASQTNSCIEQSRTGELYQSDVITISICHSSSVDVDLRNTDCLYLVRY